MKHVWLYGTSNDLGLVSYEPTQRFNAFNLGNTKDGSYLEIFTRQRRQRSLLHPHPVAYFISRPRKFFTSKEFAKSHSLQ